MHATMSAAADISGTTLDRMTSAVPPPGVSIADARLQEVADGIFAYIQPDGSWWINNTGFFGGAARRGERGCVLYRAPHPRLPGRDRVRDRPAGAHADQHPPPRRSHVRQLSLHRRHDRGTRTLPRGDAGVRVARAAAVLDRG